MKYEKAEVEVISFDDNTEFMVYSIGSESAAAQAAKDKAMQLYYQGSNPHAHAEIEGSGQFNAATGACTFWVRVYKNKNQYETYQVTVP